jgi:hypothetical protein
MKKLFTIAALAIGAMFANAQSYGVVTASLGNFNAVAANQTSNNVAYLVCNKQQNVAVQVSFKLSGAGTGAQTLTFAKSLDGSTADTVTTGHYTWVLTPNGATTVVGTTNFPVAGVGHLVLKSWASAEGTRYVTNIVVKYAVKTSAP